MDDGLDQYVAVSLKNWAVKNSPPPLGRSLLIREINSQAPSEMGLLSKIWDTTKSYLSTSQNIVLFYDSWLCDPLPRSQNWVTHIAASWRLSH